MRGTFANIRIRNEMVPGVEGGMTRHLPDLNRWRFTMRRCCTRLRVHRWR